MRAVNWRLLSRLDSNRLGRLLSLGIVSSLELLLLELLLLDLLLVLAHHLLVLLAKLRRVLLVLLADRGGGRLERLRLARGGGRRFGSARLAHLHAHRAGGLAVLVAAALDERVATGAIVVRGSGRAAGAAAVGVGRGRGPVADAYGLVELEACEVVTAPPVRVLVFVGGQPISSGRNGSVSRAAIELAGA